MAAGELDSAILYTKPFRRPWRNAIRARYRGLLVRDRKNPTASAGPAGIPELHAPRAADGPTRGRVMRFCAESGTRIVS
jgi:hypothetical protein